MSKPKDLVVHQVPINKLKPAVYNPRRWEQSAIDQLTESIKRFGLVDPLIVNNAPSRKMVVIGGHFRLKVAKDLGFKHIPVVFVTLPDIAKEKELNLRLNRNTGEWDLDLLKNFDIEQLLDVGFDDTDLASIWDEALSIEDDQFDVDKAVEAIETPQTKPGDLIKLGEHRLICGDATDPKIIKKLVGSETVDILCYDPPYNINLDYHKGVGKTKTYGGKQTDDNKSDQAYKLFLKNALENGLQFTKNNAHIFCWCNQGYIGLIQQLYVELELESKRVCLWVKNNQNVTPQIAFNKAYEPCVYATMGDPYLSDSVKNVHEILNQEIGTGNRLPDDILDLFSIWLAKRVSTNDYQHPTQKPPTVYEKLLRRCSKPGDLVLDAFGGSGTTLIACEQLKRKALLCELEPVFCDVIVNRFQELTGVEAVYEN